MPSQANSQVYWMATCSPPSFPALRSDIDVDLAVVGRGTVGIGAARFLKDRGVAPASI